MKKIILILLCCAMLTATVSCNKNDDITEPDNKKTINMSQNIVDLDAKKPETTYTATSNSPQLDFYKTFQETVNANVYDKWLETSLNTDSVPISEVYGKCCTYWKNEFDFTIEKAKILFENETTYLEWKKDLYAWLKITQKTYLNEISLMDVAMNRLEIVSTHCDLIRQKVIDTKYFCYILECKVISNTPTNPVGLQWANDLSIK